MVAGTLLDPNKVRCPSIGTFKPSPQYLTLISRYTKDGDILFSCAKDQVICAWFSANGERLGTYHGHQGALWTVDIDPTTTLLASGAADNTVRLWDVRTGKCVKVWDFNTAVKRVEFNEDSTKLLAVTEKRMGFLGTIVVLDIKVGVEAEQSDERALTITCEESKATVAGWSYLSRYIIAGHEDGSISQYDAKVTLPTSTPPSFLHPPLTFFSARPTILTPHNPPDRRMPLQHPRPRRRHASNRPPILPRQNLLHNRLQRQNRPPTLLPRPHPAKNLHLRHPPQHRRHNTQKTLRHPRRRPSSNGRHNHI